MAKIMIVEDTPAQLDFLVAVLTAQGHQVSFASNGKEAMSSLCADTYDLVLTDIFMPDCDGLELIRAIRTAGRTLPVIAMSAGLCGDIWLFLRSAKIFGADAVMSKTQPPHEIAATVAAVLGGQRSAEPIPRDA